MLDRLVDVLVQIWHYIKPLSVNLPYNESIVFRLGRVHRKKGPGPVWLIPGIDQNHKARKDIQSDQLPAQCLTTQDGQIVIVKMGVVWYLEDVDMFLLKIQDDKKSMITQAMCTLAELVRKSDYDEIRKPEWHKKLYAKVKDRAKKWGIDIEEFEVIEFAKVDGNLKLYNEVPDTSNSGILFQ